MTFWGKIRAHSTPALIDLNQSIDPDFNYKRELGVFNQVDFFPASIHSAATPLGSLLSGVLMDRCGRKLALQIASLPLILGWVLISLAQNHTLLLVGRVVAGLSAGLTAAAGQVRIIKLVFKILVVNKSTSLLIRSLLGRLQSRNYAACFPVSLSLVTPLEFFSFTL